MPHFSRPLREVGFRGHGDLSHPSHSDRRRTPSRAEWAALAAGIPAAERRHNSAQGLKPWVSHEKSEPSPVGTAEEDSGEPLFEMDRVERTLLSAAFDVDLAFLPMQQRREIERRSNRGRAALSVALAAGIPAAERRHNSAQGVSPGSATADKTRDNYTPTVCALGFAASNCLNTYCRIPPLA